MLDHHVPVVMRTVGAGGQFYVVDRWMMGVAQRSYHLLEGFLQAFDAWNVTVAAPLVRFQIENIYRTVYIAAAPNGPEVVMQVMGGKEFRDLKAYDSGRRLTDRELVERVADLFPWLPAVYEKSNEWVHLSDRHIFNANRLKDGEERTVAGRIPLPPDWIPVGFLAELLAAMREATEGVFGLFDSWEDWKLASPYPDARQAAGEASDPAPTDQSIVEPDTI